MKIVLAGGTGFIGRKLIDRLLEEKHEVILLSRKPDVIRKIVPAIRAEFWDAKSVDHLTDIIDGTDAVINLAGESISAIRWTSGKKQRILSSRIDSTRAIVSAIGQADHKPSVLLNASAVGYYGNVPEGDVIEDHPKGTGFLADVCAQWEAEARKAEALHVRVVLLRTGIVLDTTGGALQKLLVPFRFFVGGPLGSGQQWFPWIHIQDEVDAIRFALKDKKIAGPLNLSAPSPVRMTEFCSLLGNILHRPSWLPVPAFVLRLVLGEMAGPLVLQGQRVVPQKLLDAGFKFRHLNLEVALRESIGY